MKPAIGTTRPISRTPFGGWHQFANLPAPDGSTGYRMIISRAGDWTAAFIDDPPEHVWVRGIPTTEMANVRKLFAKVGFVATGSGIAPILGHLLTREPPSRLVWVTKDPVGTYGEALFNEIIEAQPDALIWNADQRGRPDVLRLAYAACRDSGADRGLRLQQEAHLGGRLRFGAARDPGIRPGVGLVAHMLAFELVRFDVGREGRDDAALLHDGRDLMRRCGQRRPNGIEVVVGAWTFVPR